MAKITEVVTRKNKMTGEEFLSVTLSGKPEVVVSQNGKASLRIPTLNLPMNIEKDVAEAAGIVPGADYEGTITYTKVPEYEFTTASGELLTSTRGVALVDIHGVIVCTNQANTVEAKPAKRAAKEVTAP